MQPRGDLLGVALMVQLQQSAENPTARGIIDGEAQTLRGLAEVVIQGQVAQAEVELTIQDIGFYGITIAAPGYWIVLTICRSKSSPLSAHSDTTITPSDVTTDPSQH